MQTTAQSLNQILINQRLIEELIFANPVSISMCDFQHDWKLGSGRNSVWNGDLEKLSQNLLQFRSNFIWDGVCSVGQALRDGRVRGEPRVCDGSAGEADGAGSCSPQEGHWHCSQGQLHPSITCKAWGEDTATLLSEVERQRTRSHSHRLHWGNFLLGRREMFFTVEVGEPQAKLSGEPTETFQPCLDQPWEPRPLPEASPAPVDGLSSWGHFQPWLFQDSR